MTSSTITEPRTPDLLQPSSPSDYLFLVVEGERPCAGSLRIRLVDDASATTRVVVRRQSAGQPRIHSVHNETHDGRTVRTVTVAIPDTKISRSATTFSASKGGWKVEDGKPQNPTRINRKEIATERVLKDKDIIEVGYTFFIFRKQLPTPPACPDVLEIVPGKEPLVGFQTLLPDLEMELDSLRRSADKLESFLLLGETGTGKEVLAKDLHRLSKRSGKEPVSVNCASLPDGLLEAEMFGTRKGAFTGAIDRKGFAQEAHGGTLFLDEIGDLPLRQQASMLRLLGERSVRSIGDGATTPVDILVIAATNKPLREMVERNEFREDLLQRLQARSHVLRPLRSRMEDLGVLLATLFSREPILRAPREEGRQVMFHPGALNDILQYSWPANIRELANCLKSAVVESGRNVTPNNPKQSILAKDLPGHVRPTSEEERDRAAVEDALRQCGGNLLRASKVYGMSRGTLKSRADAYGIDLEEFRRAARKQTKTSARRSPDPT